MSPFNNATAVRRSETTHEDGSVEYVGEAGSEWTVGVVPHGGYVVALLLNSLIAHQASSKLPDPIHITAHFVRPMAIGSFSVRVKLVRAGQTTANLTAELWQADALRVMSHAIFGILDASKLPQSANKTSLTLAPPSPHARVTPFRAPPAQTRFETRSAAFVRFLPHMRVSRDLTFTSQRTDQAGVETCEYWALADSNAPPSPGLLALLSDLFQDALRRYMIEVRRNDSVGMSDERTVAFWHPTLTMSLEFKFPIPPDARIVGMYAASRFMNDPNGRHDVYIELWTAPGESIGEGWREEQRCLAVAHQTAMLIPFEVNDRKAKM